MVGRFFGLVAILALVGCGGGGGSSAGSSPEPALAFVNASLDAGPTTFLLDESVVDSAIPYLGKSTRFASAQVGVFDLTARLADGTELDVFAANLQSSSANIAVLLGLAHPVAGEELQRARLHVAAVPKAPPASGKARLILAHGIVAPTGESSPNLTLQNPGTAPPNSIQNIVFGEPRSADVDAGTAVWEIHRSDADAGTPPIASAGSVTLKSGGLYVVVAAGRFLSTTPDSKPVLRFLEMPKP